MRGKCWKVPVIIIVLVLLLAVGTAVANEAPLVRVKDIARVQGVRDNQLYGLGLVVGLNGTGDGTGSMANLRWLPTCWRSLTSPYPLMISG